MIVEYGIPITRHATLQSAMQKQHFDESFKRNTKRQKRITHERQLRVIGYLKDTGDRNVSRISIKLGIPLSTLRSDFRRLKIKTKGGFIYEQG